VFDGGSHLPQLRDRLFLQFFNMVFLDELKDVWRLRVTP
jgi:hypothetical protein